MRLSMWPRPGARGSSLRPERPLQQTPLAQPATRPSTQRSIRQPSRYRKQSRALRCVGGNPDIRVA